MKPKACYLKYQYICQIDQDKREGNIINSTNFLHHIVKIWLFKLQVTYALMAWDMSYANLSNRAQGLTLIGLPKPSGLVCPSVDSQ